MEDSSDTPTSGAINISVDETFEPILKSQIDTFQKLYPAARVTAAYKPEEEVMRDLLANKARVAVLSRQLNPAEQAEFERLKIVPRTARLAVDGLAIVVHPSNPDSMLTVAQLRSIFMGNTQEWSQVSGKKGLGSINVVFDTNRSSTTRYVQDSLLQGKALTKRVFAAKSNPALLDYVATHPNTIGIVGVNWISDRDDKAVQGFLKNVRIVSVSAQANPQKPDDYVQPYQAYLALKTYPLRREVYLISREARAGLGTGFASFSAGNKGQLIVLKSGLVPATGQMRIIDTNKR
ncbi:phosphate ABC transporter substrate-binding protein, PhoT family [Hymenobacter elongatus]|uniref:Phosphate ABC transporter substrate-binding protein, PhoT family n=2 Tax=Hymenobacter elongatus TaxID=877208 RepID=A0A4Z0PMV9_9BACT|nr:phosphate ABC transporter substrate-binding protein, PhoT family [Hymenobacter elongatus]